MEINPITEVKKLVGQKPSTTSNSELENVDYDSSEEDEGEQTQRVLYVINPPLCNCIFQIKNINKFFAKCF